MSEREVASKLKGEYFKNGVRTKQEAVVTDDSRQSGEGGYKPNNLSKDQCASFFERYSNGDNVLFAWADFLGIDRNRDLQGMVYRGYLRIERNKYKYTS